MSTEFTVYPAIDLAGGQCVRLRQGDPARAETFSDDPVAVARRWVAEGARRLHVVDLDGAFAGAPRQMDIVAAVAAVGVPVQVGGGLRTEADVAAAFAAGAARVVVGTGALEPGFLDGLVARFGGGRIVVGLDARGQRIAVRGWADESSVHPAEVAAAALRAGCIEGVYTQVRRDGMLAGPDLEGLDALLTTGLRVVASGGVAGVDDVRALASRAAAGCAGVILGRALYTGAVGLRDALRAADEA